MMYLTCVDVTCLISVSSVTTVSRLCGAGGGEVINTPASLTTGSGDASAIMKVEQIHLVLSVFKPSKGNLCQIVLKYWLINCVYGVFDIARKTSIFNAKKNISLLVLSIFFRFYDFTFFILNV